MAVGNPSLFLKAHWIFSTATFLPNKHNLSFNTSSIQRVFLISAKPPSPSPEYKLSVWALWLKIGQESIIQLEKCRPLKLKTPGMLLKYCCEKKQCGQKRWRLQRRGREEMGRQSPCQVQKTEIVFWKISLWKRFIITHTRKKKKKLGKNNFLYKCNYQSEISEIQKKWRQFLEDISQWAVAQIASKGNDENVGLFSEKKIVNFFLQFLYTIVNCI